MNKKRITLLTIILALIIIMGIGTYAFFTADITGNVDQDNIVQSTGTLRIEYTEGQNIDGEKIRPGWTGIKKFTVKNTGTLPANYDIVFADLVNTFVNDEVLYRGYCNSNQSECGEIIEGVVDSNDFIIQQNITIESEEEHEYEIEIEFIETGKNQNYNNQAILSGKISVYEAGAYKISQISIDLVDNMIPITWKEDKWVKTNKSNINNDWYDYDNQKWANSVLVTTESRESYKNANIGTPILEEDILAYYVYVPRYRYQLWNTNHNENCLNDNCNEQKIKVEFEKKNKNNSIGTQNGEWLTHPAFTFGESELNGIWVGKFTTSVDPETTCYSSSSTENCNDKTHSPRIKPNMDMWRNTQVSTMFSVSKKIETESMYGLSIYDNIETHMMKNMEWGAVAYLSHSKYGKYGNADFNGANKEIFINNYRTDSYYGWKTETGCSGGVPSILSNTKNCPHPYPLQTLEATGASTTGNIYGIYDMSGGVSEYVMGNMVANGSPLGTFNVGSSGTWDYTPELRYYDSYEHSTSVLHQERGYLGDATIETLLVFGATDRHGGWYSDKTEFLYSNSMWFRRGGNNDGFSTSSGVFAFSGSNGNAHYSYGFRIVLVVE